MTRVGLFNTNVLPAILTHHIVFTSLQWKYLEILRFKMKFLKVLKVSPNHRIVSEKTTANHGFF